MCTIFPPIVTGFLTIRETLAKLTPFWTVRRQVDELIECDRRLVREYSRDPGRAAEARRYIGFSVSFGDGFYYVWTGCSGMTLDYPGGIPFTFICPEYIIWKDKLRPDQIRYMERKRRDLD
ncbi:MAG: hypothetical protein IKQ16_10190 [Lentisphaeria bacterium]|nr:hypothetical protein [Lentisphaeria bacterium]